MLTSRSGNRTTAPAAPLMDYEAGKGDPRSMAWAVAFSAGGLLIALPLGGSLIIALRPPTYGEWSGWATLGFMVGCGVFALGLAVVLLSIIRYWADSKAHRRRLEAAFELELELRGQAGGVVTYEEFEEFQFYSERPQDMLLIIMALTRRAQADPQWRPSIGALIEDGVWINRGRSRQKLGNVNTSQARKILTELADMGYIQGRTDGSAGEWVVKEVDTALDLYERKA